MLPSCLNKHDEFALLSAENVMSPWLKNNFIRSRSDFLKFSDVSNGIPIMVPASRKLFDFDENDVFELSASEILNTVYGIKEQRYRGYLHAFNSLRFLRNFKVKKKFHVYIQKIVDQNYELRTHLLELKKSNSTIGSFQTRNVPHFGHEEIILRLLDFCDHVVINPVVGPKKVGDVKIDKLKRVYDYLSTSKFDKRVSFKPVHANMYYAGPREAVHHAILRENIGFDYFTVGRDHAGADGIYPNDAAVKAISNVKETLKIKVMCHDGAAYCPKCLKAVLIGKCDHNANDLIDISGTNFRSHIRNKQFFQHADKDIQKLLSELDEGIFVQ